MPDEPLPLEVADLPVMDWHEDDDRLLAALKAGNVAAAGAFFDRYEAEVNRLVWRFLGADPEHDDVVQSVFCAALAGVRKVRKASALHAWLVSVTINTVRAEIRHRRRRRRVRPDQEHVERQIGAELQDGEDVLGDDGIGGLTGFPGYGYQGGAAQDSQRLAGAVPIDYAVLEFEGHFIEELRFKPALQRIGVLQQVVGRVA